MNNYTTLQKILHKMGLQSSFIRGASFELERILFLGKCEELTDNHLFIAGLARSGTTILLNALYETGVFASLTYEDMPFILAPNLWTRLTPTGKHSEKRERAHCDGILVTTNSPEAFEEVFWQTFSKEPDLEELFKDYIRLILNNSNKRRYLSKNNQNVRRLDKITAYFPNSRILIPFRDPLQHAYSLLTQHRRFSQEQSSDPFVRKYMKWIGHSEFGLDYKPTIADNLEHEDYDTLNHWLEQWLLTYASIYQPGKKNGNILLIGYESLCNDPTTWSELMETLDLNADYQYDFQESRKGIKEPYSEDLLRKCMNLYNHLSESSCLSNSNWSPKRY